jgi:hypothetical protein
VPGGVTELAERGVLCDGTSRDAYLRVHLTQSLRNPDTTIITIRQTPVIVVATTEEDR